MAHRMHIGLWGYVGTWGGLLLLTALTFGLSFVSLGSWAMVLALLIAAVKAVLVGLFFMHLIEQGATNRIVAVIGILFVALLCGLAILDIVERDPAERQRMGSRRH